MPSYLALYRKYRPATFLDVISQPHITTTLKNQLKTGKTAHAYLFTGSRGTGKTTCAKILAKALNCEDLRDGNPCLACPSCRLIEEGTPDIAEIDAASNNGVDDVRLLREEIVYTPANCKYRVYIIDEVHMLSGSAFNALLKTLEEPPAHVVFILATTETHKVPATILSRCQRFEFRRIDMDESASLLTKIAEKESIILDKDAALLISRISDGGMRDSLSLLDICAGTNPGSPITADTVRSAAGVAGTKHLFEISEAVRDKNAAAALAVISELHKSSKDMGRLLDELIFHYRNLMLMKLVPAQEQANLLTLMPDDRKAYEELCGTLGIESILEAIKTAEDYYEKIGKSSNRRLIAELCVIELCGKIAVPKEKAAQKDIREDLVYGNDIPPPETAPGIPSEEKPAIPPEYGKTEWERVLDILPPFIGGVLEDAETETDNANCTITLTGNEIVRSIASNPENNEKIIAAINAVYGNADKRYTLIINESVPANAEQNNTSAEKSGRLESFLKRLKAEGIELKSR